MYVVQSSLNSVIVSKIVQVQVDRMLHQPGDAHGAVLGRVVTLRVGWGTSAFVAAGGTFLAHPGHVMAMVRSTMTISAPALVEELFTTACIISP